MGRAHPFAHLPAWPPPPVTYSFTFTVDGDAADVADESIVVHGLDLDGDGMYSNFMEASLPVLCGEITRRN